MVDKDIADLIGDLVRQEVNNALLNHSVVVSERLDNINRVIEAKMLAIDLNKFHELRARCTMILKECEEFRSMMKWYKEMEDSIDGIQEFRDNLKGVFIRD